MITYQDLKHNEEIRTYIQKADESLRALGFTEHSFPHVMRVAEVSRYILETLGSPDEKDPRQIIVTSCEPDVIPGHQAQFVNFVNVSGGEVSFEAK